MPPRRARRTSKKQEPAAAPPAPADAGSTGSRTPAASPVPTSDVSSAAAPSEEATVLAYLRKYGLGDAASELQTILQKEKDGKGDGKKRRRDGGGDEGAKKKLPNIDYDVSEEGIEVDEAAPGEEKQSATMTAATGGGFGYDLDAAPTIALWGAGSAPPALRNRKVSRMLLEGRELDRANEGEEEKAEGEEGGEKGKEEKEKEAEEVEAMVNFRDEARRYIEGFTSLVTWILTLPDDPANPVESPMTAGRPPFSGPLKTGGGGEKGEGKGAAEDAMEVDGNESEGKKEEAPHEGMATLMKHSLAAGEFDAARPKAPAPQTITLPLGATMALPSQSSLDRDPLLLPPSSKPELLSLSFPLLVHTYCELLTCGLEHTALALLDTYRHLYEPMHRNEIADLDRCNSLTTIVQLNEDVIAQSVVHSETRLVTGQVALIQRKTLDLEREVVTLRSKAKKSGEEETKLAELTVKLARYREALAKQQRKLEELHAKNDALTQKLLALPFLRRARALKWNITISTSSFGALTGFVSSRDELLPMSALLQSRCHLIVERRDPLPFCPPAVLEDATLSERDAAEGKQVRWVAPVHPVARAVEAGEDVSKSGVTGSEPHHELARSILTHSEALPYPKIRLEEGEDEKDAKARTAVEFNRALLVNGFRRLEALELKQEYESGLLSKDSGGKRQIEVADPLQPSVLLATLCSSSPASSEADAGAGGPAPWLEPNIGITSASICPPDGRKVAVGCDDAAVRVWSLDRSTKSNETDQSSSLGDPSLVLLGHKNGFPVFDVDWTRNGRNLLSAGGDGTVRLWDTQAVGPYGRLSNVQVQKNSTSQTVGGPASTSLSTVVVPGAKAESLVEMGGAALSVYRGHAPSTPVWSVSSAPSGYYFASAGSDYTARIWTTDRTAPVRILSGHVSPSVNCVSWHPNCNYVLTASDDKTCRMFDIQTGRCVRLLSGSARGLNLVRVSPSGRYAAGAGHDGVVRLWDLGDGRLINELRPSDQHAGYSASMIHAMSFSACGAALAVSGEDSAVRIWDVRGAGSHLSNPEYFAAARGATATSSFGNGLGGAATASQLARMPANERSRPGTRVPSKVFQTNDVSVLDLKFTKRNLLLAVGNY
ncbi:hypothetical protein ACHAXT_008792 [Thalassiosira profunda]